MKIERWDRDRDGALTIKAVRRRHLPALAFRVSASQYPLDAAFPTYTRVGRLYVVEGRCRIAFEREVELGPGEYASHPAGRYELRIVDAPFTCIRVFPLPRRVWRDDENARRERHARVAVARVVDDAAIERALAGCWALAEDAVHVMAGEDVPSGAVERIVERAIVEGDWRLELVVPVSDRDALDAAGLAAALESAIGARCVVTLPG